MPTMEEALDRELSALRVAFDEKSSAASTALQNNYHEVDRLFNMPMQKQKQENWRRGSGLRAS